MNQRLDPAYFDLPGAMNYSGLGKTSIYTKLKIGELEARKFGKKLLISKESLDIMLAALPKFQTAA